MIHVPRGRMPPSVRHSVDFFGFWRRTHAMSFSPWREGFLADSYARMAMAWSLASIWHHFHGLCDYRGEAPCCPPPHFPAEHARTCEDGSSAESWQCGEVHRHVLRSFLYHVMVTGAYSSTPQETSSYVALTGTQAARKLRPFSSCTVF